MTLEELRPILKRGKLGIVPNWNGYLRYDYAKDELLFVNNNYIMTQDELEGNYGITNRTDLYYII